MRVCYQKSAASPSGEEHLIDGKRNRHSRASKPVAKIRERHFTALSSA